MRLLLVPARRACVRSHAVCARHAAHASHGTRLPQPSPLTCVNPCATRRAAHVAAAVANKAYNNGVATELPRPHDVLDKSYSW